MLGRFVLVLHTHLPYVLHHGRWPHGMEWLFEAASETYIPLLNVLNELVKDGYRPKLTISITPVLAEQLAHPDFVAEFETFLDEEIERCEEDAILFKKNRKERELLPLARFWKSYYKQVRYDFTKRYRRDLIGAFRTLADKGCLDIITCGATHGYFPLLGYDGNISAQIKTAITVHQKHFGRRPQGIWLPECAYRPRYEWKSPVASATGMEPLMRRGVEEILADNDLNYFMVDSALVEGGRSIGMYVGRFETLRHLMASLETGAIPIEGSHSVHEVYHVRSSRESNHVPVAIFARDVETSMQVWSSEQGYPGGEWYLDFHKKHHQSGHRYWRVTSVHADLGEKVRYEPDRIETALDADVDHFVKAVHHALQSYRDRTGQTGCLTAPFDSELFGHWWFEGPRFLKKLLMRLEDDKEIEVNHCAGVLADGVPDRPIAIPEGSWGAGGSHYVWLNHDVEWMWKRIYKNEARMQEAVRQYADSADPMVRKLLRQMARELLLMEASDWPFLISTKSATDYATKRFQEHHERFEWLVDVLQRTAAGEAPSADEQERLDRIAAEDDIFDSSVIDPRWFLDYTSDAYHS